MVLRDNSRYISSHDNLQDYLKLEGISNRKISELVDESGDNLLIFPHSFKECDDELGELPIFNLQLASKDKIVTGATLHTGNVAGFIGVGDMSATILSRFSEK